LNAELAAKVNELAIANAALGGGGVASIVATINSMAADMDREANRLAEINRQAAIFRQNNP
jgi:hypothetical protein